MSLITNQIEKLRSYAKDRKGELAKLINDAADTIEMLSAKLQTLQMEQSSLYYHRGWIPCNERLPTEDGDYLVTYEKGYAEDYGFDPIGIAPFEVDCEGFGIWQERFDQYTLGSLGSDWVEIDVVAWKPLPEPYRP